MAFREFISLKKNIHGVFCFILIAVLLICSAGCTNRKNTSSYAVSGVADLSKNGYTSEIIDLNGEWEFYPGRLLSPSDFKSSDKQFKPVFLHVPGDWNKIQNDRGYGTYRLKVILPPGRMNYSIKIKWVKTICKVWADNTVITEIGTVKEPAEESLTGGYMSVTDFTPDKGEVVFTVQIVNYQDRRGGLCYPVSIGPPTAVYSAEIFNTFLNSFVLGALAIVIIFHLTIHLYFRKTSSNLYISLICFMVMIRIFVLSDSFFIFSLVEPLGYKLIVKAEFVSFLLIFIFFLRFFVKLYYVDQSRFLYRMLLYFGLSSLVYVLAVPVYYVKAALPVFQLYIILVSIYVISGPVFSAVKRKMKGARIYFFIMISAFFVFINDIIYFLTSAGPGSLSHYVFFIFLAGHFFIIAMYFSEIFQENETLIEEIGIKKNIVNKLNYISSTDSLTELYNRRFFDTVLNTIVKEYKKGETLWLIMFDIDFFKNVNDDFGHNMGDMVLKEFAAVVKRLIRTRDILARWGGEEFCIIVEEMDPKSIVQFIERIRESIEKFNFSVNRTVTASFGIAQYKYGESATDFIRRVDDALYKAKNSGRNKIVVDSNSGDTVG
ncbi:MAG TPA: diguanylate cyclase [Spirochaetota bacterium]|nr:diguanylate cyclase [Spirochaetota bacterium]